MFYHEINIQSQFYNNFQMAIQEFNFIQQKSIFDFFPDMNHYSGLLLSRQNINSHTSNTTDSSRPIICQINLVYNDEIKEYVVVYANYQRLVLQIMGSLSFLQLFLQFLTEFYNEKVYLLKISKLIDGKEHRFELKHIFNGLSLG
jgi:hypothetical protein